MDDRITTRLAVAAGGVVGAALRLAALEVGGVQAEAWVLGAVNVIGAALLGAVVALATRHAWSAPRRMGLATGLCGGLTSMSTLALRLGGGVESGAVGGAVAEAALTVAVGVAAYRVGLAVGGDGPVAAPTPGAST